MVFVIIRLFLIVVFLTVSNILTRVLSAALQAVRTQIAGPGVVLHTTIAAE